MRPMPNTAVGVANGMKVHEFAMSCGASEIKVEVMVRTFKNAGTYLGTVME
jgi:hypothetical protein